MPLVMIIFFVVGIIFGTQFEWVYQVAAVFVFIGIMESSYVRSMEIGAIIPYLFGISFLIGMLIGDISWAIQTNAWETMNFKNPFSVN